MGTSIEGYFESSLRANLPDNFEIIDPPVSLYDELNKQVRIERDILAVCDGASLQEADPTIEYFAMTESVDGFASVGRKENGEPNDPEHCIVICGYIMGQNMSLQMIPTSAAGVESKCKDARQKAAEHIYDILKERQERQ